MSNKGKINAVDVRRNTILDMMLSGATTTVIRQWFNNNHPALSEHTMEKDITLAYRELDKYVNRNSQDVINEHVLAYDRLASKTEEDRFYDSSIRARQAKEKLLGLHKPETAVFVQNNNLSLDHLTKEDLDNLIIKLTATSTGDSDNG